NSQLNVVKVFDAATGNLLRTINNPSGDQTNDFGVSLAIYGRIIVVGAPSESGVQESGAAIIFDALTGAYLGTLYDPSPGGPQFFGASVAIDGNTLVVGAPQQQVGGRLMGAAYIFDLTTHALLQT